MRFLLGLLGVILSFGRDGVTVRGKDGAMHASNLGSEKNASNWEAERNATRGPLGKSAKSPLEGSPKGPRGLPKGRSGGPHDEPNASHWGAPTGVLSSAPPEATMFHRPREFQNETRKQADWSVAMRGHSFGEHGNGTSRPFMGGKEDGESGHRSPLTSSGRAWEHDGENATRDRSHAQEDRPHTRGDRFRMRLNSTRAGPSRTWNGTRGDRFRMPWNVSRGDRSWSQYQERAADSQAQSSTLHSNMQVRVSNIPLVISSPAASFGLPSASQASG